MKYSIIIPVYNSEKTIGVLIDELIKYFSKNNLNFEIICVNDGSIDDSWNVIKKKLNLYQGKIVAINLINNHGQQIANYCGLENSSGDYLITMDDDAQNPVSEISKLIQKSKEGFELVIGKYIQKRHNIIRRLGSRIVRYIVGKIFKIPENLHLSNFRIIKREVIDRICQLNIHYPYLPGLLINYSSSQTNVFVEHKERKYGSSKYNFLKIMKLIFELLFNHSTYPIRVFTFFGFCVASISFALGLFFIFKSSLYGTQVPGWTTVVALVSFLGGLTLIILSMIGEYLIRINRNLSSRNKYFIKELIKN
jgi:glycosyltransferase involved in cell wall biosynthesis